MRQRYFTSTAQTRLIKNILANTPIPIYDTVRPGDYIVKNCKYIYNVSLIRCTTSGTLEGSGEFITLDYTFYWGTDKLNHTERLKDNTGFYDSRVHEWLGRYLRAYRDMVGINLMPFYNCFSGVYTSRYRLEPATYMNSYVNPDSSITTITGRKIVVHESSQSYDTYSQGSEEFNNTYVEQSPYKILQIPVKLNRTYTIAIDCDSTIRIAPAFINHGHLVTTKIGTSELSLTEVLIDNVDEQGMISPLSIEKTNSVFIEPFTYSIDFKNQTVIDGITVEEDIGITYEQLLYRYQKYLYLLIQLPRDNDSSIVVLEGDYTDISREKIFSLEDITKLDIDVVDETSSNIAPVIYSSNNTNFELSRCPYVAYLDVEGLIFKDDKLYSTILEILNLDSYGYTEINAVKKQLEGHYIQADINRDGKIDSLDSLIIDRIVAQWAGYDVPDKVYVKYIPQNSNLQIYSYIPISVGTEFQITWYDKEESDNDSEIYKYNDIEENDALLDKYLLSKLSLLQLNDKKNYPFADRLVEYLTLNVIDSADEISDNIKRVQSELGVTSRKFTTYGAWNNYLRIKVYLDTINTRTLTHLDVNGYVDKIAELLIQ